MQRIPVLKDLYAVIALVLSIVLLLIGFILVYFNLQDFSQSLVISFSGSSGINFLGTKDDVLNVLLLGLVLTIINFILANFFYERIRFFSHLIAFFNVFISVLILIAIGVIISVN